jgi:hypothetical protein
MLGLKPNEHLSRWRYLGYVSHSLPLLCLIGFWYRKVSARSTADSIRPRLLSPADRPSPWAEDYTIFLEVAAHSLKSKRAGCGAKGPSDLCRGLEMMGKAGTSSKRSGQ